MRTRLSIAVLLTFVLAATASPQASVPAQMGSELSPSTVTVGDHFTLIVRVRAPRGARIAFPPALDTTAAIEAVASPSFAPGSDTGAAEMTARYPLVAWDTGSIAMPLPDVVVTLAGAERHIPLRQIRITVRSVLPRDTALHVPKPARDILETPRPWWWWLPYAAAAAALIALLIWWWRRRARRRPPPRAENALAYAEREFSRIEALGLIEAGERGRFVALMIEVLRHYLAARILDAPLSLTSTELVAKLRERRHVPVPRLAALLSEADLIKFARRPVTAERARDLAREARAIVREVEKRLTAPAAPAERAA